MFRFAFSLAGSLLLAAPALASSGVSDGPRVGGIPAEFFLFAATLVGVALFHHNTLQVALGGLAAVTAFKLGLTSFDFGGHLAHEAVTILNLFGLLTGFGLLADHFERSNVPELLPKFLPNDWKGGLVLLWLVFVLSSFLDNIAAAMIGGTVANAVFNGRVHIGYLAAIVAASNAGGSGSVVGDTTTTMMWLAGVSPFDVIHAYAAAFPALAIVSYFAAVQQHAYQPIQAEAGHANPIDWGRVGGVAFILAAAIAANVATNSVLPGWVGETIPVIALAIWAALLVVAAMRSTNWGILPEAVKGSFFLLSLVLSASMMPVSELPGAAWQTALGLGFVSAVFDNIPLTKLAIAQGGYDWGFLAYAVGYGGSMVWFGSSAGVALSNQFPQMRNAKEYVVNGWHVTLGYVVGFFILLGLVGWHPHAPNHAVDAAAPAGHEAPAAPAH
jgi:Na+/H+ antiporter NhaD/arsenite permease-like protein